MSVQSMGKMEKDICPNFLKPLLKTFDVRGCNDGGVPSKAASIERAKKKFR